MNLPTKILRPLGHIFLIIILFYLYFYLSNPLEITVTGTGSIQAQADSAKFTITLSGSYSDVDSANEALSASSATIRNYLTQEGILPENLKENDVSSIPLSPFDPIKTDIRASKTILVSTSEVSSIYSLTDQLYSLGAKSVSEPIMMVSDKSKWEFMADEEALKNAEEKAVIQMKKFGKVFKRIAKVSPLQSEISANNLNFNSDQDINPFQGIKDVQNSQLISKSILVTFKAW